MKFAKHRRRIHDEERLRFTLVPKGPVGGSVSNLDLPCRRCGTKAVYSGLHDDHVQQELLSVSYCLIANDTLLRNKTTSLQMYFSNCTHRWIENYEEVRFKFLTHLANSTIRLSIFKQFQLAEGAKQSGVRSRFFQKVRCPSLEETLYSWTKSCKHLLTTLPFKH